MVIYGKVMEKLWINFGYNLEEIRIHLLQAQK